MSPQGSFAEGDAGVIWQNWDAGKAEREIPQVLQSGGADTQVSHPAHLAGHAWSSKSSSVIIR